MENNGTLWLENELLIEGMEKLELVICERANLWVQAIKEYNSGELSKACLLTFKLIRAYEQLA